MILVGRQVFLSLRGEQAVEHCTSAFGHCCMSEVLYTSPCSTAMLHYILDLDFNIIFIASTDIQTVPSMADEQEFTLHTHTLSITSRPCSTAKQRWYGQQTVQHCYVH